VSVDIPSNQFTGHQEDCVNPNAVISLAVTSAKVLSSSFLMILLLPIVQFMFFGVSFVMGMRYELNVVYYS
jgi:hypothetical protein